MSSTAVVLPSPGMEGIDVSRWQGLFDWSAAWAQIQLRNDEGVVIWAECLGIAWPPPQAILDEIIDALAAGKRIWYER